jgi:hypothetical protein
MGGTFLSSPISPTSSSSFAHTLPIGTGNNGTSNESDFNLSLALSHTPPMLSLLLSQNAHQLLSHTWLKLIASVFGQVCNKTFFSFFHIAVVYNLVLPARSDANTFFH